MGDPKPTHLAVTVFLRHGDDVLLMKRSPHKSHEPNKFCGVGGKVDDGETIIETSVRETKEEAGITLAPEKFVSRGQLVLDGYPEARWAVSLFEAWPQDRQVANNDEGELIWVPINQVAQTDLMDDIRYYVEEILNSQKNIFGHFMFKGDTVVDHTLQFLEKMELQPTS
ncbi:NUDIX domain-containing protein [Candidatus Berkelbacteria bacterium]|nr:NUDIX domain-containing protein [Candidatus Berkelbacteria bacterium]